MDLIINIQTSRQSVAPQLLLTCTGVASTGGGGTTCAEEGNSRCCTTCHGQRRRVRESYRSFWGVYGPEEELLFAPVLCYVLRRP